MANIGRTRKGPVGGKVGNPGGAAPDAAFLAAGGVEVWVARVGELAPGGDVALAGGDSGARAAGAPAETDVAGVLAPAERARAARFRVADARARFVAGRVALRRLAGGFLGIPPVEVEIEIGERGKPALSPRHASPLHFNLAHSGEIVLVAFALGREVGVDVEHRRPLADRDALIARFLAPAEREALLRIPEAQRTDAFFDCWARKEALLKAWAAGLALPLDAFTVPAGAAGAAGGVRCDHPDGDGRWWLFDLEVDPAYAAALAVRDRGPEPRVALRRFPGVEG